MPVIAFVKEITAMLILVNVVWPLLSLLLTSLLETQMQHQLEQWLQGLVLCQLLHHGNVLSVLVLMENVWMNLIMATVQLVTDLANNAFILLKVWSISSFAFKLFQHLSYRASWWNLHLPQRLPKWLWLECGLWFKWLLSSERSKSFLTRQVIDWSFFIF